MGILDSILGSESSVEFRKEDLKTETQKKELDDLIKLLSGEIKGADVSGTLTPEEQQRQDLLTQLVGGAGGDIEALREATRFDQAGIDELFQTTIRDPLVRDVRENIIPDIGARFGSQFFSSERIGQEGRAIDELVRNLSGERSKLVQGERQRQLQALGLLPAATAGAAGLAKGGDVASQKLSEQDRKRKELMQLLLGGTGQNVFENIGVVKPGQTGVLSGFLGGIGQGLATPAPVAPK